MTRGRLYQAFRWWGIGTRNIATSGEFYDFIRHSDGGVSELPEDVNAVLRRLYQAFRWWGIGTTAQAGGGRTMTLSGIPMVGYRNSRAGTVTWGEDFIRHSDGGVSEPVRGRSGQHHRLYQAFRWWGIGTNPATGRDTVPTLSGIPMVGYRNEHAETDEQAADFIRHSDGGVSERDVYAFPGRGGLYQAFRWWGIGTLLLAAFLAHRTLSGIPMVGYRNKDMPAPVSESDFIRHSDGGVSELFVTLARRSKGLYQAFRWWGIGTAGAEAFNAGLTLSGIPMVGYRNAYRQADARYKDFIRHSDGGVSELQLTSAHRGSRTLSGIPMVGYRNEVDPQPRSRLDFIRHSDGGSAATALRVDLLRGSHALRWIEGACHVR